MDQSQHYLVNTRFFGCVIILLWSTCISCVCCSSLEVQSYEGSEALNAVVRGSHNFAISLYQAVSKSEKNVLISPLSVQLVLALTYTGAKGQTADELTTLLALPNNTQLINTGYNELIKSLENPVLKIANKIFVDTSVSLKDGFQKNAEKYFLSSAKNLDFLSDPELSRNQINDWVEENTNQKISGLLAPGMITSNTLFVLINAIYFKASWRIGFPIGSTEVERFFTSKHLAVPVLMMNTKGMFDLTYSDELMSTILKLDYEEKDFNMFIVLPDDYKGLPDLESHLEKVDIFNIIKDMETTEVFLSLPRFQIEETVELNSILQSLGVETMFSNHADFSGMTDQPIAVDSVVQKAYMAVNEIGTEAVAATALLSSRNLFSDTVYFSADHPFLFFIMYKDLPVFMGRFSDPKENM